MTIEPVETQMGRRVEELSIIVEGDSIHLSQSSYDEHGQTVVISPDQVDEIVQWLQEAREEIRNQTSRGSDGA